VRNENEHGSSFMKLHALIQVSAYHALRPHCSPLNNSVTKISCPS
jgi:hypothetical protein